MGRINTLVSRAILGRVNSDPGVQTLQVEVLAEEVMDGVEHVEPYGFTSSPLEGAEGVVLNVGGQRGACIAINFHNRQFRLQGLKSGEVALYTHEGDTLVFSENNHVTLKTKHFKVEAEEDAVVETKEATIKADTVLTLDSPLMRWRTNGVTWEGREEGDIPTLTMKGNIVQDGSHTSTGDQIAGSVSQMHHKHTGDSGGTTGEPLS
jgi:phage baseplate assembly protein V